MFSFRPLAPIFSPSSPLLQSLATPGVGTYADAYDVNKNRTAETITGVMNARVPKATRPSAARPSAD
ncbi:hypothetical protein LzC2_22840 [Planctomycetes bacterium LzC2]|uniref:Uncharacterized protein n=1 Tax=Alienimonas chondri TaxID=2681879 RepID=A0ABX1VDN3_9PLAN|nr:hypothetical protein [Alienimonas chondri]